MSDETIEPEPEEKRGLSRRNALKAGVAVGVGVAAWSGASITSLGGTPAYAALATAAIVVELSGGCTNVDSSSGCVPAAPFRFHTLDTPPPPFTLVNNPGQGTCCNNVVLPILQWTEPLTCTVVWLLRSGQGDCKSGGGTILGGASVTSAPGSFQVTVPLNCGSITPIPSNSFYRITALCNPIPP